MIKVNVLVKDEIKEINMIGHAGYDEYGKDIVCSAASSIVITSVNAILSFNSDYISYQEEKNKFSIKIKDNNEIVDKLITNMLNLLKELEQDYPKYIKIKEEIL